MQNIFHKWQNVVSYYQDGSQSKICTVDNRAGSEGMKRTWVSTLCHLPHEWSLTGEGSQSFDDWVTIQGASVRKEGKTCDLDVGFVIGLIMAINSLTTRFRGLQLRKIIRQERVDPFAIRHLFSVASINGMAWEENWLAGITDSLLTSPFFCRTMTVS